MAESEGRRSGIERKILSAILLVGIIPITVALIVGYAVIHESQRRSVERTLLTAAEKTASGLLLALDSRLRTVKTLARDPEIIATLETGAAVHPETPSMKALVERLREEGKNADDGPSTYSLFDGQGRLLLSTGVMGEDDKLHDDWLDRVQTAMFVSFKLRPDLTGYQARTVSPVFASKDNGAPSDKPKRIGFLCEDQGANKLLDFGLGRGAMFPGAATPDAALSDSEGGGDVYQVAHAMRGAVAFYYFDAKAAPLLGWEVADPRIQAELSKPNVPLSGTMKISNLKTRNTSLDVILAYRRLFGDQDRYQLYVVIYRPASAVFAGINQWAFYSFIGSILAIAVFLMAAYRSVHNNIVRPLSLLNEGAQIIRQGDLELKLKIGTGDEIEELASSFNKMALALNQNISQLEDSEEKYRSLVTSMRDGIFQTDPLGSITFINPAGAEIFGLDSPNDALGMRLKVGFPEDMDYERIKNDLFRQGFVERTRVWMKRKDSRSICVELSGNRMTDEDGTFIGVEGIFRDVTNSVRLEQQARERSERISAINQIANVINSSIEAGRLHESLTVELKKLVNFDYAAVVLFDERGDGLGHVEPFAKLQLWPPRGPLRPTLIARDTGDEPSIQSGNTAVSWVARNRKSLSVEDLQDGPSEFAAEFPEDMRSCLCVPLFAMGRIIGTLNLGADTKSAFSRHDIDVLEEISPHIAVAMRNARLLDNLQQSLDEVTRAREKLHEVNEELKTLDEMKTNLLSNVSHELRTPLVSVMGYTDMLFHRKVGPINEVQHEYLGIILRNIEKLVTLIENLLDFSRLHRGTERMVFDVFDLVDCARTSVQTIQPVADSRKISIECVASSKEVLVDGDKGKMGQVFNNLLSNAVKFNNPDGKVTIIIQEKEDTVEVSVNDTGIGIPPEALDKVFTRFYQYDSSSTRKYGGTGIGLSIAQDIARLHGSRITVTSEAGKGSSFRFSLPLNVPRMRSDAGDEHLDESGTGEPLMVSETQMLMVLVTQDRGLNLQLHDLLVPEGIDLIHAIQASSVVDLARKYHPDCILFDVDGLNRDDAPTDARAMLDHLLSDPKTSEIPVVLITGNDEWYESFRRKVAARIKPGFRKSSLLSGIHYALSQGVPIGEQLGRKILCVDDDPEILIFISRCLEAEGYTVDTCSAGEEAIEKAASKEYGLVLLDLAMPGMDGWEVCHQLKCNAGLAGIKIFFVTAKPIDRSTSRIQDVGADGYLLKPFRPEDLVELVNDALAPAGGQQAPPAAPPNGVESVDFGI